MPFPARKSSKLSDTGVDNNNSVEKTSNSIPESPDKLFEDANDDRDVPWSKGDNYVEQGFIENDYNDLVAEEIVETVEDTILGNSVDYVSDEEHFETDDRADLPVATNSQRVNRAKENVNKDEENSKNVQYFQKDGKLCKKFNCVICGKEFAHQYTLMRHLPTHTNERKFKCNTCGKAFRQMSTLSQHRAIHSDARPYVCELCQKTFNRVSTLISHRKTHLETKPHICEICGKGFHQKGNLKNHMYTHTNERPYKCDSCGHGFNQMSNLMCHKVKAHARTEKKSYACGICKKEFPKRFALRNHEEYKHGIKYRSSECHQELDSFTAKEIIVEKQKKQEQRPLRIIHLPNGDKTLASVWHEHDLLNKPTTIVSAASVSTDSVSQAKTHGVIIDAITTKAMQSARRCGKTPFALLKPEKGIPVLVKILDIHDNKQILVPATPPDLKSAGVVIADEDGEGNKTVQIKVPVVATIFQKEGCDGQIYMEVEDSSTDKSPVESASMIENDVEQSLSDTSVETSDIIETNPVEVEGEVSENSVQYLYQRLDGEYECISGEVAQQLDIEDGQLFKVVKEEENTNDNQHIMVMDGSWTVQQTDDQLQHVFVSDQNLLNGDLYPINVIASEELQVVSSEDSNNSYECVPSCLEVNIEENEV